jgi:hypothetical protein
VVITVLARTIVNRMTAMIHAYSLDLWCREIGRKAQQCAVKGSLKTWGGDDRDVNDELVQFWVTKTCWRAERRADIPQVRDPQPAAPTGGAGAPGRQPTIMQAPQ